MPLFRHRDLEFFLSDDWWGESGIRDFKTAGATSFRAGLPEPGKNLDGLPVLLLDIDRIRPVPRQLAYGQFRDKDSAMKVLQGIVNGEPIPPVLVRCARDGDDDCTHILYDGAHRLYCSIVAGFSRIPAIDVGWW